MKKNVREKENGDKAGMELRQEKNKKILRTEIGKENSRKRLENGIKDI